MHLLSSLIPNVKVGEVSAETVAAGQEEVAGENSELEGFEGTLRLFV